MSAARSVRTKTLSQPQPPSDRRPVNNAEVLFPSQIDLRVVTGKVSRGQHYAALMARDTSSPDIDARDIGYKILAQGPSEGNRRASVMKLLDDVEKRIAKDIMDI